MATDKAVQSDNKTYPIIFTWLPPNQPKIATADHFEKGRKSEL